MQKAASVALRVGAGMEWKDIGVQLEVDRAAVCRAVNKVVDASTIQYKENLNVLLRSKELDPKPAGGQSRRFGPGSATANAIREGVLTTYEHYDQADAANFILEEQHKKRKAPGEISKYEPNPKKLRAPQVARILRDQAYYEADPNPEHKEPILRKRELNKKDLDSDDEEARLKWVEQAKKLKEENAILICVDETKINCGGTPNHHVSALQGLDKYGKRRQTCFTVMQWGAACGDDVGILRPHTEWVAENDEQKEDLAKKLAATVQKAKDAFDTKMKLARQPGTEEYQAVEAENERRKTENARRNIVKQKGGRLPQITPEQFFKYIPFVREATKGMGYVYYAFGVYEKILFPYFVDIQKRNLNRKVYISEDKRTI